MEAFLDLCFVEVILDWLDVLKFGISVVEVIFFSEKKSQHVVSSEYGCYQTWGKLF